MTKPDTETDNQTRAANYAAWGSHQATTLSICGTEADNAGWRRQFRARMAGFGPRGECVPHARSIGSSEKTRPNRVGTPREQLATAFKRSSQRLGNCERRPIIRGKEPTTAGAN
jgi:hypothetical protein